MAETPPLAAKPTDAEPSPANQADAAVLKVLENEDPVALALVATEEQIKRFKAAEELLGLRHDRKRRASRAAAIAQMLVGYVALAGFFANAYQNYTNQKQAEARSHQESDRWAKEFKRAQDADKYRAFFETSALATDPNNPDKRLVGYALLKEFVDDKDYSTKAIFMLEESLALELRGKTELQGLGEQRRLAVVAILAALSHASDCRSLGQAARSIDKLAANRPAARRVVGAPAPTPTTDDTSEDTSEDFSLFVRRLIGRAVEVCGTSREFREVRRPIRDALLHFPELGGPLGTLRGTGPNAKLPKISHAAANLRIAEILRASCEDETQSSSLASDCADVEKGYARICAELSKQPDYADEEAACKEMLKPPPIN